MTPFEAEVEVLEWAVKQAYELAGMKAHEERSLKLLLASAAIASLKAQGDPYKAGMLRAAYMLCTMLDDPAKSRLLELAATNIRAEAEKLP